MKATRTPEERLREKLVTQPSGCHEWTGATVNGGYGVIRAGGRQVMAHRLAWELQNGPIQAGLDVCHRCDNPPCCNTDHLFLGTRRENMQDMFAKGRQGARGTWQRARTHCPQGHSYAEHAYVDPRGWRNCRICVREAGRRRDQKARRAT